MKKDKNRTNKEEQNEKNEKEKQYDIEEEE